MKITTASSHDQSSQTVAGSSRFRSLKKLLPFFLLVGAVGCGPGYTFSPYVGQQQNWQTQPASYVKVVDKANLYMPGQFPDRPYIILGAVTTDNEQNVAKAVHEQHADAALVYTEHSYRTGTVAVAAPGVIWGVPLRHSDVSAQLIKFR